MIHSFFKAFGNSRFGRQIVVGYQPETKNLLAQFGALGLLTFSAKKGIELCNGESTFTGTDDKKAKTGLSPGNGS